MSEKLLNITSSNNLSSDHTPIIANFNGSLQHDSPQQRLFHVSFQNWLDVNLNFNILLKSSHDINSETKYFQIKL